MTDAVIRLDKSKPYSECRGERQTDDPLYRVHFWQGQLVGRDMILLPFDAHGDLVPDDGKTETWDGKDADGKPVTHHPLYNRAMRDLLEKKRKRQAVIGAKAEGGDDDLSDPVQAAEEVNLVAFLRGEANYPWALIQKAARARYSRVFTTKQELVTDLVLDEGVIPEDQLSPELASLLPKKAAA